MSFPWFRSRRSAYQRLLAEVNGRDVVREAEEVVGSAWMENLLEATRRAAVRTESEAREVSEFVHRERKSHAMMAKARALGANADRERLSAASRRAQADSWSQDVSENGTATSAGR